MNLHTRNTINGTIISLVEKGELIIQPEQVTTTKKLYVFAKNDRHYILEFTEDEVKKILHIWSKR